MRIVIGIGLLLLSLLVQAQAPRLLHAGFFGGGGDRIEGAAFAPDDSLLIAGTLGEAPNTAALGIPAEGSQYRTGFVARLSPDGKDLLRLLPFAPGLCQPTSVLAVPDGTVYIAGYAHASFAALFANQHPLIAAADVSHKSLTRWAPFVHRHDPQIDALRHDERGTPFVLHLDADLKTILGGTFLEGWQSVWHVPPPLGEDQWQPVDLARLPDGDLLVSHDGGILRDPGARKPDHRDFYHLPDHVSRLSPDLRARRWKQDIFTPQIDPAKVKQHLGWDWPHPTLGNTRIQRLRTAPDGGSFCIVGWSPSETAEEPWWSPFCFVMDPASGTRRLSLYTPSPMDGDDGRMNNLVSDAAVHSVNYDSEGKLLLSPKGDGGNSILLRDPRDFRETLPPGVWNIDLWGFGRRTLFWGGIVRIDPLTGAVERGKTLIGRDGSKRVTPAWAADLAPLPDGRIAVLQRHSIGQNFSSNAWSKAEFPAHKPGASLLLLQSTMQTRFASSLGDVYPYRIETKGNRGLLVGQARSAQVVTSPGIPAYQGNGDGYVLLFDLSPEP